jgi:coenzyme F420-reducing hydrogenase alpha subunit
MTRAYPEAVRRGVKLQALGNAIMSMLGGRSVHPVGVRIGGFSRAPSAAEAAALHARLREALPLAEELVHWTTSLAMPDVDQSFINVALRSSDGYAIEGGRIVSSDGLDIDADAYPRHFTEVQVPHSTALQARYDGRPYMVGPLARLNLNIDRVPFALRPLLQAAGVTLPSTNPYHAIVARAVEVMLAIQESIRLLTKYRVPEQPGVEVTPRAGSAAAMTEAPRGLLWQRWETDAEGRIVACNIVPPTSQNQARIEEDLRLTVERMGLDSPEDALRARCEQVIRNYDPCISCATHFLRLKVTRRGAR